MTLVRRVLPAARLALVPVALGVLIWARVSHGHRAAPVPTTTPVIAEPSPPDPIPPKPADPVAEARQAPDRPPPAPEPTPELPTAAEPKPPTVVIDEPGRYMLRIRVNGTGAVLFPIFDAAGTYPVEVRAERQP